MKKLIMVIIALLLCGATSSTTYALTSINNVLPTVKTETTNVVKVVTTILPTSVPTLVKVTLPVKVAAITLKPEQPVTKTNITLAPTTAKIVLPTKVITLQPNACLTKKDKMQVRTKKIVLEAEQKLNTLKSINDKLLAVKGKTKMPNLDTKITAFGVELDKLEEIYKKFDSLLHELPLDVCDKVTFKKAQKNFAIVNSDFKVSFKAALDLLKNGIRPDLDK